MQQIAPNIYTFSRLIVGRVYLIEEEAGLTIIDASISNAISQILHQVVAKGHKLNEVKRVLLTHAHPDHYGSLHMLQKATQAEVWTSAAEKEVVEKQIPIPQPPLESLSFIGKRLRPPETFIPKPATVNRVLNDGEVLPEILGGLQVVATPGHAPGHLAFWHPERKILFCGDVLFNWPNLRLPFAPLTVDMTENKRSIAKIAALEPEIVCFGHGRPLVKNAAARLKGLAKRYR